MQNGSQALQVFHKGQHPYRHKAKEIGYTNGGFPSVVNVKDALDDLYGMAGGTLSWQAPVANPAALPVVGNSINDARIVTDDGDGKPAVYVCVATVGTVNQQWTKIADVDWGTPTLDYSYDAGGSGLGRQITADSGAVEITIPDTAGNSGFIINNDDTTNNPDAFQIVDATTGDSLFIDKNNAGNGVHIDQTINSASDGYGVYVEGSNAGAGDFIAAYFGGNVGINNTTPAHALDMLGDALIDGRIAAGNNGVIGGSTSFESNFVFEHTITDFSSSTLWASLTSYFTVNPAANLTTESLYGADIEANVLAGNNKNILFLEGAYIQAVHFGTGTVTTLQGAELFTWAHSTGNVTNMKGLSVSSFVNSTSSASVVSNIGAEFKTGHNGSAGSMTTDTTLLIKSPYNARPMTTHYGLYIENQAFGTTSYAIYSAGGLIYTAGDVDIDGRIASGNTATLGFSGSYDKIWNFSHEITDFSSSNAWNGLRGNVVLNPSIDLTGGSATYIYGCDFSTSVKSGNTKNIEALTGLYGGAFHNGTGTLNSMQAFSFVAQGLGAGNITTQLGAFIVSSHSGTGSIGTNYGAYLASGHDGSGGSISVADYTVYIATPGHARTLASHYGLFIQDQAFGTVNWAVFIENGKVEFGAITGQSADFQMSGVDVTHGLTTLAPTNSFFRVAPISGTAGGVRLTGISDTDAQPFEIKAVFGSTNPTDATAAFRVVAGKSNGTTGIADLANTETAFEIMNNATSLFTVTPDEMVMKKGVKKNRVTTATDYNVLLTDYYVGVTSTAAVRTITLPTVATAGAGKIYVVKDESGGAGGGNAIVVDGNGAETIDGAASYSINSNYGSVQLICTGSAWMAF